MTGALYLNQCSLRDFTICQAKYSTIKQIEIDAAKRQNQAERDIQAKLAREEGAEDARREEEEKEREDAATLIQKHVRGALARMASKQLIRERRMGTLLKRLSEAAQRLEAAEDFFTEAELRQLAADVAALVALLKVRALSSDCISARYFTWMADQINL